MRRAQWLLLTQSGRSEGPLPGPGGMRSRRAAEWSAPDSKRRFEPSACRDALIDNWRRPFSGRLFKCAVSSYLQSGLVDLSAGPATGGKLDPAGLYWRCRCATVPGSGRPLWRQSPKIDQARLAGEGPLAFVERPARSPSVGPPFQNQASG